MANPLYEVRLTFDVNKVPKTLVFRSELSLEQAVQLANSLWLSTDNVNIQVSVASGSTFPAVVYHCRNNNSEE